MTIQDACEGDLQELLRLNTEFEHFLSPLTRAQLHALHQACAYSRVAVRDERIAAFLLALREGASYDSSNYLWFAARYKQFLYIDRVVVRQQDQGQGIGSRLYSDLFEFAKKSGITRVTCEFDFDPPNDSSALFHQRLGFVEVGRQRSGGGRKLVSLQELRL